MPQQPEQIKVSVSMQWRQAKQGEGREGCVGAIILEGDIRAGTGGDERRTRVFEGNVFQVEGAAKALRLEHAEWDPGAAGATVVGVGGVLGCFCRPGSSPFSVLQACFPSAPASATSNHWPAFCL